MKIDLLKTPELFHGIASISKTETGYYPERMTPELLAFYSSENESIRAHCPAGVRISFFSNTSEIQIDLKFGRNARMIYSTDIVIDEQKLLTFTPETECDSYAFTLKSSEPGEHLYEIWLPNMCETEIADLQIDDGASLVPLVPAEAPLVFIGDSITQGMTSSSPSRCYAALLSRSMKKDLINLSIGGAEMKKELGMSAQAYPWDAAIIAFGVNDCFHKRSLDDFKSDTHGLLQALSHRKNAEIYILTPIPYLGDSEEPENTLEVFRECIRRTAADFPNVIVIEGTELLPHESRYFTDGIHPNDDGMKLMAENLYKKIKQEREKQ